MDSQEKTFGLSKPHEYLDKLEWEFEQMMKAGPASPRELTYHAMNLAMTGWHMTDWVHPHFPESVAAKFSNSYKFQEWVKSASRVLAACRDVATASKHMTVKDGPDPAVQTVDVSYAEPGYFAEDYTLAEWHVSIDGELYGLREFGSAVVSFWQNYLESLGLLPN